MKIGVFLDTNSITSTLENAESIQIYRKDHQNWIAEKTISVNLARRRNLSSLRKAISNMIIEMSDCKVIVARSLTGIAYNLFDRQGFHIWEFDGKPAAFLETIRLKEESFKPVKDEGDSILKHYTDLGNGVMASMPGRSCSTIPISVPKNC